MSEDQCTICFERLGSDKIAALPCRHVYHHSCILHWMRTSRNGIMPCPICKHSTNRHGIVGPLYIECIRIERKKNNSRDQPIVIDDNGNSRDNTTSTSSDSDNTTATSNTELESLRARLHQAEEKASQLAARNMQLEDRNRNLLRIKKVADLDVNMGWSGSSSQMDQMRGLPHDELIVAFEALRARCSKTEIHARNLEDIARLAQQRYQNLVSEKEFFERKFNALTKKVEQRIRKEKRRQAESANHGDRSDSHHPRGGPNTPVILYRHTEITASPSGNSGLPMGQEQGSLSDNDDSSETNDEMDQVSSKKSGKRPMVPKKRRLQDYLHRSPSSTHDTTSKEPADTTPLVWDTGSSDVEDYGLTVVEPRRSSSSRCRDTPSNMHMFPNTNSVTNGHRGHVIDLTDD
ncbi:predicted protein [Lichtheimia corymbifera JMRC:FSU:9682]|uniref:RING-type domain-containing protein n=1 Tax=Lichtheimia corymbifera JMRC:FSU:9682 TaxID=1263082 RepID=A0A068SEP7_9FUNG|nr:predicted protein [Lichtheimia corymbifera JMRC:FSU:9682]